MPIRVVVLVAEVQVAQPCGVHAFVYVLLKYNQDFQARHIPPQAMKEAMERQKSEARQDTFKGWIFTYVEMTVQPVGVLIHVPWDRTNCSQSRQQEKPARLGRGDWGCLGKKSPRKPC